MKINFDNNSDKSIWITISRSNIKETAIKEKFYKKILFSLLNASPASLITIEPQDYSLAYEIPPYQLRTISGDTFLVNTITNCDIELIEKIVLSEEFTRTLLIIVKNGLILSDKQLGDVIDLIKNETVDISEEVIFCEDDGESLCIYNSNIALTELIAIAQSLDLDNGIRVETSLL